jgi:DNA topoisomerase IB
MMFRGATAIDTSSLAAEGAQMAIEAGLVYVSCSDPGIRRMRAGRGFYYLTPENRRLTSAGELKRIASLAVPPAYKDVWICVSPRGHLQATGHDARGRKQYRYHPNWRQVRDNAKFDRMVAFGRSCAASSLEIYRFQVCHVRRYSRRSWRCSMPPAPASATRNTRATTRVLG